MSSSQSFPVRFKIVKMMRQIEKYKKTIKNLFLGVIVFIALSWSMNLQSYQEYLNERIQYSFENGNRPYPIIPTITIYKNKRSNDPAIETMNNSDQTIESLFDKELGPTTENGLQKYMAYLKTAQSTIDFMNQTDHKVESIGTPEIQQLLSEVPEEIIPLTKISYPDYFWRGKQLPLITGEITGNIMGEYATLLALKRLYNVSVLIHPNMKKALSKDFAHLSLNETVADEDLNNSSLWYSLPSAGGPFMFGTLELASSGLLGPKMFFFKEYGFEAKLWKYCSKELKKEFTFSTKLQKQADDYLHFIGNKIGRPGPNIVYIGFHISRTDHSNDLNVIVNATTLPGDTYFELALNYYRKKINNPVFIAASDNATFLQNSIVAKQKDVFISEGKSRMEDLAILASCNHSIITFGTNGFWAGYLAGGEVVYPKYETPMLNNDPILQDIKLPNFTPIMF